MYKAKYEDIKERYKVASDMFCANLTDAWCHSSPNLSVLIPGRINLNIAKVALPRLISFHQPLSSSLEND